MSEITERAKKLRAKIEEMAASLSDKDAESFNEFFPEWNPNGASYKKGDRVRYNGTIYKVLSAHSSQSTWTPEGAPSLFSEVLIPDENVIPGWKQPGSTNPYMKGDKVKFNGATYQSTADNNVWEPGVYGWEVIK